MVGNLFREEASRDKESNWFGKVKITSPPSHRILSFIVLAISACILAFLTLGHFTRRQEATGYLVPSLGMLNISSPSAATVLATFVTSGQKVIAGQRLLTLSSDLDSDVIGPMNAYILQSLRSKKAILTQEISDRKRLTEAQTDALKIKVALLRDQLGQIEGQIDIQRNIVLVTEALLTRFKRVSSEGFISGLQMQQQESTAYQAQSTLKSLLVQHSQIELQVADSDSQLRQLPTELATELNSTRSSLADIDQAEARSAADQTLVLKAPRSGIISAMLVTPGQAVRDGQQILSITPTGSTLQAQFLVPSKSRPVRLSGTENRHKALIPR
jgi:membrane fusion protein